MAITGPGSTPQPNSAGSTGPVQGGTIPPAEGGLGTDVGMGFEGEFAQLNGMTQAAKQAAANLCNLIARNEVNNAGAARGSIFEAHTVQENKTQQGKEADRTQHRNDTFQSEQRATAHAKDLPKALEAGDMAALEKFFNKLMGGKEEARRAANATNPTSSNPAAPQGRLAAAKPFRSTANAEPKKAAPSLFPNISAQHPAKALTQPRLAQLQARVATMPEGSPKTEAQKLEQRLQEAVAQGDHETAAEILEILANLGFEVSGEEPSEALEERRELEEIKTEAEGEGSVAPEGAKEKPIMPRRIARTFSSADLLEGGLITYSGAGDSQGKDRDYAEQMRAGLRLVCGGSATKYATQVATENAVRGSDAEEDGGRDGAGGGSRGNAYDPVALVGSQERIRFDVTVTGALVAYTADGRVIGGYQIENPADNPSVRRISEEDRASLATLRRDRSFIFARATSGSSGERGVYHAGMMC